MRTKLLRARPILPVAEIEAALAHYRQLGFRGLSYDEGYGFLTRGRVEFHVSTQRTGPAAFYLDTEDADALYAEWAGVAGTEPPGDMPWGMREGRHVDPWDNVIRFGTPLEPEREASER